MLSETHNNSLSNNSNNNFTQKSTQSCNTKLNCSQSQNCPISSTSCNEVNQTPADNIKAAPVSVPYSNNGGKSVLKQTTNDGDNYEFDRDSKSIESDLIDLTSPVTPSTDLYSSDIEAMNNYLKSLPNYDHTPQYYNQPTLPANFVKPKEYSNYYPNYQSTSNNMNVSNDPPKIQGYQQQFHQVERQTAVPISKSNSMHTFSKRNIQTVQTEKESFSDVLKNKISKSTSTCTIPHAIANKEAPIESPKKSSNPFFNIFRNLNAPKTQNNPQADGKNAQVSRKNSTEGTKRSISDFWRDNISSNQNVPKFGWNYHKITQNQAQGQAQSQKQPTKITQSKSQGHNLHSHAPKPSQKVESQVHPQQIQNLPQPQVQPQQSSIIHNKTAAPYSAHIPHAPISSQNYVDQVHFTQGHYTSPFSQQSSGHSTPVHFQTVRQNSQPGQNSPKHQRYAVKDIHGHSHYVQHPPIVIRNTAQKPPSPLVKPKNIQNFLQQKPSAVHNFIHQGQEAPQTNLNYHPVPPKVASQAQNMAHGYAVAQNSCQYQPVRQGSVHGQLSRQGSMQNIPNSQAQNFVQNVVTTQTQSPVAQSPVRSQVMIQSAVHSQILPINVAQSQVIAQNQGIAQYGSQNLPQNDDAMQAYSSPYVTQNLAQPLNPPPVPVQNYIPPQNSPPNQTIIYNPVPIPVQTINSTPTVIAQNNQMPDYENVIHEDISNLQSNVMAQSFVPSTELVQKPQPSFLENSVSMSNIHQYALRDASHQQSSHGQNAKVVAQPSSQKKLIVKKLEQAVPNKAVLSKKDDLPAVPIKNNVTNPIDSSLNQPTTAKPHYKIRKNYSHSQIDKKMKDNIVLTKEDLLCNKQPVNPQLLNQDAKIKSTSNNYIYMNQDDPDYFKNLHKITKTLDNATANMIVKPSIYKSISNSCVPSYITSNPGHPTHHVYYNHPMVIGQPGHPHSHQFPNVHAQQYPPVSYKAPGEHFLQHSGSKSHIPVLFKYPMNKSSSNSSIAIATPITCAPVGFYNVHDKPLMTASGIPLYWPAHINKSSSSSCIYAKTLSQPAHLSRNNDIFSRYKPIMSDNESEEDDNESEEDEDDTSKRSNLSTKSNISSATAPIGIVHPTINKPFMLSKTTSHQNVIGTNAFPAFKSMAGSSQSVNANYSNYPPFTKISSIQIPINGQLPPAFSKDKNNIGSSCNNNSKTMEGKPNEASKMTIASDSVKINNSEDNIERSIADIYNVGNNLLANSNRASVKSGKNNNGNIFYAFGSTALQPRNDSSDTQPFTPYSKYLTDRKYFDMQFSGSSNQAPKTPPSKKKDIGVVTNTMSCQTVKSMIPTFKEKVKTVNNIGMKQESNPAEKTSLMSSSMCFQNNSTCGNKDTDEPPNSSDSEYTMASNVAESSGSTAPSSYNEKLLNDIEILSTFDPYYIPSTLLSESNNNGQDNDRSSTTKLHQLLSTVSEQWNNINNEDYSNAGAFAHNSNNSKHNSVDNYGTDQYSTSSGCMEVHSFVYNTHPD